MDFEIPRLFCFCRGGGGGDVAKPSFAHGRGGFSLLHAKRGPTLDCRNGCAVVDAETHARESRGVDAETGARAPLQKRTRERAAVAVAEIHARSRLQN